MPSALALALALAGCGDAGRDLDAGRDAAVTRDAGRHDAAAPTDGGHERDAGAADADTDGGAVACPASSLGAGDHELTIEHGGRTRRYLVHVPPSYTGAVPTPLVLSFHGGGGNLEHQLALTGSIAKSDEAGFLLVFPNGTGVLPNRLLTWNAGICCGYAAENDVDDVGFVAALLDALETQLCVDPRRVYATGHSNGAMLSYRLACELSDRIAAVMANAGGMGDFPLGHLDMDPLAFDCRPTRPVPILHLHGLADEAYPWDGGCPTCLSMCPASFQPVPTTIDGWVRRNGCATTATSFRDEGTVRCVRYGGCDAGADVELCTVADGGHNWPGGEAPTPTACTGVTSTELLANDEMWRFFAAHPL